MDSSGKINDLRIIDASKLTADALVAVNSRHNACVENRTTGEGGGIFTMDGIQVGSSLMQVPFTVNTPEGPITIHSVTNQQMQQNFAMAVPQAPPGTVQKMQVMNSTPNMPIITVIMPDQGGDSTSVSVPVVQALPDKSKSKAFTRVACSICDKTFSCGANLRDHMRLHTGEKPFKCSECPMEFAQRSNWRLHKRVHTGERPFMCGICGKTFARSSHLPGHVRMHTGERPFTCELCNASFSSAQALKNHSRTHTGEKPYVCNSCNTPFTHSSSLSSHKKKCDGMKRRRGRPAGPGPKATRKKKEGITRPRGRPKKKLRLGRGRKKIQSNTSAVDDIVDEAISSSQIDENDIAIEASNDDEDTAVNLEMEEISECKDEIEKPETTKANTKVVRIPSENQIQRGSARLRHKRNKLLQELNHNEDRIILDNGNSSVFEDHDLNVQNSNGEAPSIFIPNNDVVGKDYIIDSNSQSQPTIVTYVAPVNLATNSYVSEISQTYSNECSES